MNVERQTGESGTGAAIELRDVSKRYRYFELDRISFRLEPGQILGFVGPNGAGKSTTIRILMGLVARDSGEVELVGRRMPEEQVAAKRDVGFVSEEMRLFGGATLAWHMGFVRSIFPGWDEPYALTDLMTGRTTRETGADLAMNLDPATEAFRIFTISALER